MDTQSTYADNIVTGMGQMFAADAASSNLSRIDHVTICPETLAGLLTVEAITTADHKALQAGERARMTIAVEGKAFTFDLLYDPQEDGFVSRTAQGDMVR